MWFNKYFIDSSIIFEMWKPYKVIFSAGKIIPSLYNFMLELNTSVIHCSV